MKNKSNIIITVCALILLTLGVLEAKEDLSQGNGRTIAKEIDFHNDTKNLRAEITVLDVNRKELHYGIPYGESKEINISAGFGIDYNDRFILRISDLNKNYHCGATVYFKFKGNEFKHEIRCEGKINADLNVSWDKETETITMKLVDSARQSQGGE